MNFVRTFAQAGRFRSSRRRRWGSAFPEEARRSTTAKAERHPRHASARMEECWTRDRDRSVPYRHTGPRTTSPRFARSTAIAERVTPGSPARMDPFPAGAETHWRRQYWFITFFYYRAPPVRQGRTARPRFREGPEARVTTIHFVPDFRALADIAAPRGSAASGGVSQEARRGFSVSTRCEAAKRQACVAMAVVLRRSAVRADIIAARKNKCDLIHVHSRRRGLSSLLLGSERRSPASRCRCCRRGGAGRSG